MSGRDPTIALRRLFLSDDPALHRQGRELVCALDDPTIWAGLFGGLVRDEHGQRLRRGHALDRF